MILRKFEDHELAAELQARGFLVFGAARVKDLSVSRAYDLLEDEQLRIAHHATVWRDHIAKELSARLASEILTSGALLLQESDDRGGARKTFRADVRMILPRMPNPTPEGVSPAAEPPPSSDPRPSNCRNRLQAEGKSHPKSGCSVPGCIGVFAPSCRQVGRIA